MAKRSKKNRGLGLGTKKSYDSRSSLADEIEFGGLPYSRDELIKFRDIYKEREELQSKTGKDNKKRLQAIEDELFHLSMNYDGLLGVNWRDLDKALEASAVANKTVQDEPSKQIDPAMVQKNEAVKMSITTDVQIKNVLAVAERYKQKYTNGSTGKYMPDFKKPAVGKNNVKLAFPTSEEASTFYQEEAQKRLGEGFVVFDKNKKVMAYSNGDGTLYKASGQPYAAGEKLVSSNMSLEDLKRKAAEDTKLAAKAEFDKESSLSNARQEKQKVAAREQEAAESAKEQKEKLAENASVAEEAWQKTEKEQQAAKLKAATEPAGHNKVTNEIDRAEATTLEEKQKNLAKMLNKHLAGLKKEGVTDEQIAQKSSVMDELKSFNKSSLKPIDGASSDNEASLKPSEIKKAQGNGPKPAWMTQLGATNSQRRLAAAQSVNPASSSSAESQSPPSNPDDANDKGMKKS